jgi:ABC transporter substrate binding protein
VQQQTRSVPTVFVQVSDPVDGGYVASLARPGGNITGFTSFEDTISAKWLELRKEVVPQAIRVAIIRPMGGYRFFRSVHNPWQSDREGRPATWLALDDINKRGGRNFVHGEASVIAPLTRSRI